MKFLIFNHHPDCLLYMYKGLSSLGHEVEVASEKLTLNVFGYSSTKGSMLELADQLIEPLDYSEEFNGLTFVDELNHDYYISIRPEVSKLFGWRAWFDCQLQGELMHKYGAGIKTCNHPNAESMGFQWVGNWVPKQGTMQKKKYITQLMTLPSLSADTAYLTRLAQKNPDLIKMPQLGNFIRDKDILPETALLVHNKPTGINCYAVCKALDMGIPVYMSSKIKSHIGFDDLPNELFFFAEQYSIEEAYEKSLESDSQSIQSTYRSIYTLERLQEHLRNIINGL